MNGVLLAGLMTAMVMDWRTRRIPNGLTLPLALCGLLVQGMLHGMSGLGSGALGFCIGILLLLIPFAAGGIGAGDVKLLAAVGAWTGPWGVVQVFLAAAVFGGLFCLVEAVRHHRLKSILQAVYCRFFSIFFLKVLPSESRQESGQERLFVPYGAAICAGYAVILWMGGIQS